MFNEETNKIHVIDFGNTETFEYYGKRRSIIFSDITHIISLVEYFGLTRRWQPFVTQLEECKKTDTQKLKKVKPKERVKINKVVFGAASDILMKHMEYIKCQDASKTSAGAQQSPGAKSAMRRLMHARC